MTPTTQYDAILIGAGQSGVLLSTALARAGWKTALIERVHVGGTCINEGCSSTKSMVASGRVAYLARRGADYGVQTGPVTIDMTKAYCGVVPRSVRQKRSCTVSQDVRPITPLSI